MRVALVGNNDGPLILANSMQTKENRPVCICLQKPVSKILKAGYIAMVGEQNYFSDFSEPRLLETLESFDFDILINCFCNFKFKTLLERYTVLNVHLAPLPRYRGRHPLHWALINGETEFGFTVHKMDADFDAGEIYWQDMVSIAPGMSVEELRDALMTKLAAGFGDFLEDYTNDNITPRPNEDAKATYAPKRNPEDSRLTEWHDRDTIYRKVMALRSGNYPAYFKVDGEKIPVIKAVPERDKAELVESDEENSALGDAVGENYGFKNLGKEKRANKKSKTTIPTVGGNAFIEKLYENGISVLCRDGKRIQLYGFHPTKYKLAENQELI